MSETNIPDKDVLENINDAREESGIAREREDKAEEKTDFAFEQTAESEMTENFEPITEGDNPWDYVRAAKSEKNQTRESSPKSQPSFYLSIKSFVRSKLTISALVFILSVTMLLLALFAPFAYSEAVIDEYDVEIEYTGVDLFKVFYCSLLSMSDRQIANTSLYEQTMLDYMSLRESMPKSEKMEKLSQIGKNMLFITLARKNVDLRFETVFAAVALSLILLICAFMLFSSLVSLSKEVLAKVKGKKAANLSFKRQLHSLWLLFFLLPVFAFSMSFAGCWGKGENLSSFSVSGHGISYGTVLLVIFTVLVSLYSVLRIALINSEKQKDEHLPYLKKLLMLLLVFAVVISAFMPIISISFYKRSGVSQKTENLGISMADVSLFSSDDIKYYKTTKKGENEEILLDAAKDIFRSSTDKGDIAENLLGDLIIGVDRNDVSIIFLIMHISAYVLLTLSALLLLNIARSLFLGEHRRKSIRRLKIFVALFAMVQAVLGIVLTIIAMLAVSPNLSFVMSVDFGLGPVLLFVFALFLLFVRVDSDEQSKYADCWYDNADVTYAPYIVKKS